MPHKEIAATTVELDNDGYLTNRTHWNRDVATALATELGITLTDAHWKVIDFIDRDFREKGAVPGMRRLNKIGNIPTKELYALFPEGPIKKQP